MSSADRERPPTTAGRSGRLVVLVVAVALLAVVGLVNRTRVRHVTPQPVGPTASATPTVAPPISQLTLPGDPPLSVVLNDQFLFVLSSNPPQVLHVDPLGANPVLASAPAPGGARYLVFDPQQAGLWVIADAGTGSTVSALDPLSLSVLRTQALPFRVQTAVAVFGTLWLGTSTGVYALPDGGRSPVRRAPDRAAVQAFVTDSSQSTVFAALAGTNATALLAFDPFTGELLRRTRLPLTGVSLATPVGQLWVAGRDSNGEPHLTRLVAATLRAAPGVPGAVPLGSVSVFSGSSVLWMVSGTRPQLSCLNPLSGAAVRQWPDVSGPVASRPGLAFAFRGAALIALTLPRGPCYGG